MWFWSKPTFWYTDPRPFHRTLHQLICTNRPRQSWLPCLPIRNTHYQIVHCQWLCLLWQKRPRPHKIDDSSLNLATSVQITWHIQKNRQNNQKIKLSMDMKNPTIRPVWGALQMVMRTCCLAQPNYMPVACYRTKKAPLLFITGSRIATLLCKAVKKVRPSTSADDLKKYSAHSLCVWACVLLDEVGMSPSFIQKRLRCT